MKKLLIATDGFLPRWDGIASFLNEMIPRIENDYELTILAPDSGELKQKYKAEIFRFNTLKIRLADNYYACLPNIFKISEEIKKTDLVFVQCLGTIGVLAIILSRIHKKKVIMYNHMLEWEVFAKSQSIDLLKVPINILTKFLSMSLYSMCSAIIVSSIEHAELLTLFGNKSIKKVVHLGVDNMRYKPPFHKNDAKKTIGIDPKKFVIGYAGRVSYEKDPKTLYRAFVRFSKKYNDSVLLIAGGGRPELEKMFSGKENIILTGLKDNLAPYYQAMDVYVLPSLTETTSLTTMEAMSTGLPVIVTPVGFIKEYINDGDNGMLFPKKNAFTLYQNLEYLYLNEHAREKLGKKARETIEQNYTWEKTAQSLRQVIDSSF
jgi:glycosyltransferase involved in cell wall biosynthesis